MTRVLVANALRLGVLVGAVQCSAPPEGATPEARIAPSPAELAGSSWRLVEFRGGDDTTLRPDDRAKYTITFEPDGRLRARIDCNRGRGSWKSTGPPLLELGPLALTRAQCPPGSLHDQIVKQWPYVRSYVMRNGHLFLALMADGGIYEFEPMSAAGSMDGAVRGTAAFRERMALPLAAASGRPDPPARPPS